MTKMRTTEEFIAKAKLVHGDKYTYSSAVYTGAANKIEITCPVHGVFWKQGNNFLRGVGCYECTREKLRYGLIKSTSWFVSKALEVHGSRYDYSEANYNGARNDVTIICHQHGRFFQRASHHLNGRGCDACGGSKQLNTEDFIVKSQNVHGSIYDYSISEYTTNSAKIKILCKKHGVFAQVAASHMVGNGCPKCDGKFGKDTEEFIRKSREIHAGRYDYSKSKYLTTHTPVTIICSLHGEFDKTPAKHLRGSGCPSCATTGFNKNKHAYIYVVAMQDFCGFGITCDIKRRLIAHRKNALKLGFNLELVRVWEASGNTAWRVESFIKTNFHILNSGVEGFKKEAVDIDSLEDVMIAIDRFLTEEKEQQDGIRKTSN
jgi:hypothetical protein